MTLLNPQFHPPSTDSPSMNVTPPQGVQVSMEPKNRSPRNIIPRFQLGSQPKWSPGFPRQQRSSSTGGFTWIELLVVMATVAILLALGLAQLRESRRKAARDPLQCARNLQQIHQALMDYTADHTGKFPWELPRAEGGSSEDLSSGRATPHFRALTNYLFSARTLQCPLDLLRRRDQISMRNLEDSSLSYALNVTSMESARNQLLISDRTVSKTADLTTGTLEIGEGRPVRWAVSEDRSFGHELAGTQEPTGNVIFRSGTLMEVTSAQLEKLSRSIPTRCILIVP